MNMVPIFVVLTILTFVLIDVAIQARKRASAASEPRSSFEPARAISPEMVPPAGLFIHPGHAWAELRPDGRVRIGVDGFMQQILGRIDQVELQPAGARVKQGDPLVVLEQNGRRLVLPAPLSGTVQAANLSLETRPQTIAESPYGNGWLYTLRPSGLGREISGLRVAETAAGWLREELGTFTRWLTGLGAAQTIPALQDGGLPPVGVLAHLNDTQWREFQSRFVERHELV